MSENKISGVWFSMHMSALENLDPNNHNDKQKIINYVKHYKEIKKSIDTHIKTHYRTIIANLLEHGPLTFPIGGNDDQGVLSKEKFLDLYIDILNIWFEGIAKAEKIMNLENNKYELEIYKLSLLK